MIDVLVASSIMSLLVVAVGGLLAVTARSELASSTTTHASTLAASIANQAAALGCGDATGYGTSNEAGKLTTSCTWGTNYPVSSLGDIAMPGQTGAQCGSAAQSVASPGVVPGPACYVVPGLRAYDQAGLGFQWAWSSSRPNLAAVHSGQSVSSPPDELVTTAVVEWQDHGQKEVAHRVISAVPDVLSTAWATGGMGMVVVSVPVNEPVGLDVPDWPQADPGPIVTPTHVGDGWYAVFAYVPAGHGYTVWAGQGGGLSATFTVSEGSWTAQSVP